jgi:hypothetical protein
MGIGLLENVILRSSDCSCSGRGGAEGTPSNTNGAPLTDIDSDSDWNGRVVRESLVPCDGEPFRVVGESRCASAESPDDVLCVRAGSLPASSGILTSIVDPGDAFGGTIKENVTPSDVFAFNVWPGDAFSGILTGI